MTTLTNSAEGGSNTTAVTTGNSGGASGNAFDVVTVSGTGSVTFSSTHAAHGTLAYDFLTGATGPITTVSWTTSMGTQGQVWFRIYLWIAAAPGATRRIWEARSTGTLCGGLQLNTTGTLSMIDSAGTAQATTVATFNTSNWFRVEGFVVGSATVGQVSVSLYNTMDSGTATETDTSAASLNTTGSMNTYNYGIPVAANNVPAFWFDDLGLSSTGALGPAVSLSPQAVFARQAVPRAAYH